MQGINVGAHYIDAISHKCGLLVLVDEASGTGILRTRTGDLVRWPLANLISISYYDRHFFIFSGQNMSASNEVISTYLLMQKLPVPPVRPLVTTNGSRTAALLPGLCTAESFSIGACEKINDLWVAYLDTSERTIIYSGPSLSESLRILWDSKTTLRITIRGHK